MWEHGQEGAGGVGHIHGPGMLRDRYHWVSGSDVGNWDDLEWAAVQMEGQQAKE